MLKKLDYRIVAFEIRRAICLTNNTSDETGLRYICCGRYFGDKHRQLLDNFMQEKRNVSCSEQRILQC